MSRTAFAALLAASVLAVTPAAHAQDTPADLAGFNTACAGAQDFLLGEVPEGIDPATILRPLCGCLGAGFKDMPQKDVDILAADLRGEGTDEAHAAHGGYLAVEDVARSVFGTCMASPEVQSLIAPMQAPPPAEAPAAPSP